MRSAFAMAVAAVASVGCGSDSGGSEPSALRFRAVLNGASHVIPVPTGAVGTADFTADSGVVTFTLTALQINEVMASHIHMGDSGIEGGVVVPLFEPSAPTGQVSGTLATGTITGAGMSITLDSLLVLMSGGHVYVNVHTVANPGGEIRGQIRSR
jgi:hypothetical protein